MKDQIPQDKIKNNTFIFPKPHVILEQEGTYIVIKISPMRNPISLALESYKMSNIGKVVVGSMIAQVAVNALGGNSRQQQQQPCYPSQQEQYDAAQAQQNAHQQHMEKLATELAINLTRCFRDQTSSKHTWPTLSNEKRREWMIYGFEGAQYPHLIPYLYGRVFDQLFPV